ncbi:MAG: hypothetical protein ACETV0_02165 [Nitrososphaeria archaeon]
MHIATWITLITIATVTIASELSAPFKDALAAITGHHWVTKGLVSFVVFLVLLIVIGLILRTTARTRVEMNATLWNLITIIMVFACGGAIFGFYLWHFFAA